MEFVLAVGVALRALSGVGQRGENFYRLRMPAGLPPGHGWPESRFTLGLSGRVMNPEVGCAEEIGSQGVDALICA